MGRNPTAKSIILFSDGTGNSSAQLFKTNVWRMYEAVDLGPSPPDHRDQIAYYDNGVGTSSFRPLWALGGIFGYGLQRNVLEIYRYACRNYREGDWIYGFGFSRGAFTIRVVIALIAAEGLVQADDELEFLRLTKLAVRSHTGYRRARVWENLVRLARGRSPGEVREAYRRRLKARKNFDPKIVRPTIRFVGVWDTVSAYGGPFAELIRAIDNWILRLSMPDYELDKRVQCARHALAIDDARETFHPLLWDEVCEKRLVEATRVMRQNFAQAARGACAAERRRLLAQAGNEAPRWLKPTSERRLRQIWFTGMHADVGGGYPDESLSYVSLLWMIEEAQKAGLRTLDVITERFLALANSFGPLHDSRSGAGLFYRYQPRKIEAWVEPGTHRTLGLRDPMLKHGLLERVEVHESVIARIADGTDGYAPINLTARAAIIPPEQAENQRLATTGGGIAGGRPKPAYWSWLHATLKALGAGPAAVSDPPDSAAAPLVLPELRTRLADPELQRRLAVRSEALWDYVWQGRFAYFLCAMVVFLLVALGFSDGVWPAPDFLSDGRNWLGGLIGFAAALLPDFGTGWTSSYERNPLWTILLIAVLFGLNRWSARIQVRLRDDARAMWRVATDVEAPIAALTPSRRSGRPARSGLQSFRNGYAVQRLTQIAKWHLAPGILGPVMIATGAAALLWLAAGALTQLALPGLERGDALCGAGAVPTSERGKFTFFTRELCHRSGFPVAEGADYVITFEVTKEWRDSSLRATPLGLSAGDFPNVLGYLAVPFRRVVTARYLQPIGEIRPPRREGALFGKVYMYPLELKQVEGARRVYRTRFTAPHCGELFFFANDAVIPRTGPDYYDLKYFYERSGGKGSPKGNDGAAIVSIAADADADADPQRNVLDSPSGGLCGDAAAQVPRPGGSSQER